MNDLYQTLKDYEKKQDLKMPTNGAVQRIDVLRIFLECAAIERFGAAERTGAVRGKRVEPRGARRRHRAVAMLESLAAAACTKVVAAHCGIPSCCALRCSRSGRPFALRS